MGRNALDVGRFHAGRRRGACDDTVHSGDNGKDTSVFIDRTFLFHEPPAGLKGLTFLKASIDGGLTVTVEKDGLLDIITPAPDIPGAACSQAAELESRGFTWIKAPAAFQCFGENAIDRCRIYQKRVKAGDSFQLKKWAVYAGFNPAGQNFFHPTDRIKRVIEALQHDTQRPDARYDAQDIQVNRPDYAVFIPKQPRDKTKRDPAKPGDTYNDHFQVIERDGKLFAFWTQASRESDIDQHIAFSKSLDKGETWSDPLILAGSPNKKIRPFWPVGSNRCSANRDVSTCCGTSKPPVADRIAE